MIEPVGLASDQRVHREEQSQSSVLMPPLLKLRKVPKRSCTRGELTNVEVLESHEERMELVDDLRLWCRLYRLINWHHPDQVFCCLRDPRLLDHLLTTDPHLPHLIKRDCSMNHVVTLDPLYELPMWFTMGRKQNIWMSSDELLTELCMVIAWDLRHFCWIFLHLGTPSGEMFLKSWAHLPHCCQRCQGDFPSSFCSPELVFISHDRLQGGLHTSDWLT